MTDPDTAASDDDATAVELSVSLNTACYVISLAREFDVKVASTDPSASEMDEDDMVVATLEDRPSDPVEEELTSIISDLDEDAQIDLVALTWLGRGDGTLDDWPELRRLANQEHNGSTAGYLCGTPLLADYLGAGLAALGLDCTDFLRGHG